MGCTHCLNNATPCGNSMSEETFVDVLDFIRTNEIDSHILITGGEPTEHPNFVGMMQRLGVYLDTYYNERPVTITIATNGLWIQENPEEFLDLSRMLSRKCLIHFQVSTDPRYYPTKIMTHKRIFRHPNISITESIDSIYPMGRARDNRISWNRKSPHCFNVRAIAKQIPNPTIREICNILLEHGKICTPHIRYNGDIALGESDLCPTVSTIYNSDSEIVNSILDCKCMNCKEVIENIPETFRKFLI